MSTYQSSISIYDMGFGVLGFELLLQLFFDSGKNNSAASAVLSSFSNTLSMTDIVELYIRGFQPLIYS